MEFDLPKVSEVHLFLVCLPVLPVVYIFSWWVAFSSLAEQVEKKKSVIKMKKEKPLLNL